MGKSVNFVKNCKKKRIEEEKDSRKYVVKFLGRRGALSLTRLEVLIVPPPGSCLGDLALVGIIIRGYGCRDWLKRGDMVEYCRIIVVQRDGDLG